MKLYELTQNYINLQDLLENPDIPHGTIQKALDEVGEQFEEKAENVAKLIKNMDADMEGFKREEERLAAKRKVLENRQKSLKGYLDSSMKATGKSKLKGKLFTFLIQKNPASVDIIDEKLIPKEYVKTERTVLKKEVLAAIKEGKEVPGAVIKQSESIRIR